MTDANQGSMEVSFRYLNEFRSWLNSNRDKEIVDIKTSGGLPDMFIIVTYRS